MHTTLVDMFLLFAYHFCALEGHSWRVVNMSSVRGAVLFLDPCGLLSLMVWPSFWTKNNAVHFGSLWPDMARTHD